MADIDRRRAKKAKVSAEEGADTGAKTLCQTLSKLIQRNQELRIKFASDPSKFMKSELDLHESIEKFRAATTSEPTTFHIIIRSSILPELLNLLLHENQDISIDIVQLLSEFTDPEAYEPQQQQHVSNLIDELLANNLIQLVFHHMKAIEESKSNIEAQTLYNSFQILENLIDYKSSLVDVLCSEIPDMITFLINRMQQKENDPNKFYAVEILSIILQAAPTTEDAPPRATVITADHFDLILQAISPYRKRDPASSDEEEFVENLFQCLASCLLLHEHQDHFRKFQGFELMLKCVDSKLYVRECAIVSLDRALTNNVRNCERFIELGGIKHTFRMFMGRSKLSKAGKRSGKGLAKEEELSISIVHQLVLLCPLKSEFDVYDRLMAKFFEKSYEKCDRLIELLEKYQEKRDEVEDNGLTEAADELLMESLGFNLQKLAFVITSVASTSLELKKYLKKKLHEINLEVSTVRELVIGYAELIGDSGDAPSSSSDATTESKKRAVAEAQKDRFTCLAESFAKT